MNTAFIYIINILLLKKNLFNLLLKKLFNLLQMNNFESRKVTEKDLFGEIFTTNYSNISKPNNVKIPDYRKQGEYGQKKFIKP